MMEQVRQEHKREKQRRKPYRPIGSPHTAQHACVHKTESPIRHISNRQSTASSHTEQSSTFVHTYDRESDSPRTVSIVL